MAVMIRPLARASIRPDSSSMANTTPASGALNAAAIPCDGEHHDEQACCHCVAKDDGTVDPYTPARQFGTQVFEKVGFAVHRRESLSARNAEPTGFVADVYCCMTPRKCLKRAWES